LEEKRAGAATIFKSEFRGSGESLSRGHGGSGVAVKSAEKDAGVDRQAKHGYNMYNIYIGFI